MKTTIEHPIYGTIAYDTKTDKVTVQRGNLAERITWLMHHQDQLSGPGIKGGSYYPDAFYRACEVLGIVGGEVEVSVKIEGPEPNLPPEAEF